MNKGCHKHYDLNRGRVGNTCWEDSEAHVYVLGNGEKRISKLYPNLTKEQLQRYHELHEYLSTIDVDITGDSLVDYILSNQDSEGVKGYFMICKAKDRAIYEPDKDMDGIPGLIKPKISKKEKIKYANKIKILLNKIFGVDDVHIGVLPLGDISEGSLLETKQQINITNPEFIEGGDLGGSVKAYEEALFGEEDFLKYLADSKEEERKMRLINAMRESSGSFHLIDRHVELIKRSDNLVIEMIFQYYAQQMLMITGKDIMNQMNHKLNVQYQIIDKEGRKKINLTITDLGCSIEKFLEYWENFKIPTV